MGRRKRLRKLGWRWRRNPLRRRTDLAEAWLGVVTVLLFCTVPAVGWWAGHSVNHTLQRVVRTQRADRTLVTATVVPKGQRSRTTPSAAAGTTATTTKAADPRRGDILRWTAPDHSVHTATVSVDLEVWHSGAIRLWTDRTGNLVPPPLDAATAATHSALAGIAAATSAGGALVIANRVLMWRMMRRRLDTWEREWARVGQDWGHAGAGG